MTYLFQPGYDFVIWIYFEIVPKRLGVLEWRRFFACANDT